MPRREPAAKAAGLSVGGLYHYFPTKRDLVLHGLDPRMSAILCGQATPWHERFRHDPRQYLHARVATLARLVDLVRPSVRAAVELGVQDLAKRLDSEMGDGLDEVQDAIAEVAPDLGPEARRALHASLRRAVVGYVLDATATPDQLLWDLDAIIADHVVRAGAGRPTGRRACRPVVWSVPTASGTDSSLTG